MVNGNLYMAGAGGYRRCEVVKDAPALSWSELRRELEAGRRPAAEPEKKPGETADGGEKSDGSGAPAEKPAKRSRRKPAAAEK